MTRVAWLTDIHLNFLTAAEVEPFLDEVAHRQPDTVLLSGDVSESHDVCRHLRQLSVRLASPIYFVLGNHDYYFSSIRSVRSQVVDLCRETPRLTWLTGVEVVQLSPSVGLVGHDGWADCRLGDYERSTVMLNDYRLIDELAGLSQAERWPVLKAMGDAAADHFRRVLPAAIERYAHVVLVTHVPPFRESCCYEGRVSDDEWLPHFSCQAVGEVLVEVMQQHPDRQLTVLCGHTHSPAEVRPISNIHALTGTAQYGAPEIQRVFEFDP